MLMRTQEHVIIRRLTEMVHRVQKKNSMCTLREQTRQRQATAKLRLFLSDVPEAGAFLAMHGLFQTDSLFRSLASFSGSLEFNVRTLVNDQVLSVVSLIYLFSDPNVSRCN